MAANFPPLNQQVTQPLRWKGTQSKLSGSHRSTETGLLRKLTSSHQVLFTLEAFTDTPHFPFAALCVETGDKNKVLANEMPAKAAVGGGKDPALCLLVLAADCFPCWLGASCLLTHGAPQGLGTPNQEIAAFVCASEDSDGHLSFSQGESTHTELCVFPSALPGHPKLP